MNRLRFRPSIFQVMVLSSENVVSDDSEDGASTDLVELSETSSLKKPFCLVVLEENHRRQIH